MKSVAFSLGALALLLVPHVVFGDEVFVPLTSIPGVEDVSNQNSLSDFLNTLYRLCVGAAAVLAVIQITRAGMVYMLQDSFTEKKEAKHLIYMSLLGLVLVLAPTVVFSVIDQRILSLEIDASGLALGETSVDLSTDGGSGMSEIIDGHETNDQGALNDVCVADNYSDGDVVGLEDLAADGTAETGVGCCNRMEGETDEEAGTCTFGSVSRWVINTRGRMDFYNSSGDLQSDAAYRLFSVGNDQTRRRDKDIILQHGFLTEAACEAVLRSSDTLKAHIASNPVVGRVRLQRIWNLTWHEIDLSDVEIVRFRTIDTRTCQEVTP